MDAFSTMMGNKTTKSGYSILKGSHNTEEDACYLLQFDGLSNPNPGVSTGGAVMFSPNDRKVVFERGEFIQFATNNQAEYTGLLIGIKSAVDLEVKHLLIEGDSQLVIFQIQGKWKLKNEGLKQLHKDITTLLKNFEFIGIRHVRRDNNQYADKITNDVFESRTSYLKTKDIRVKSIQSK